MKTSLDSYPDYSLVTIRKGYRKMASRPKFPSTPVSVKRDERQVIVSINNPHTQGKEVADFLRRLCTVVRDPTKIIDENVFCTANWSVTIRLWSDPSSPDGLQHLPITCNLGNSEAFITYLEMPPICEGSASIICQTTCQKSKDWLWKTNCNLQGRKNHVNVECPRRVEERFIKKEGKTCHHHSCPGLAETMKCDGVLLIRVRKRNHHAIPIDPLGTTDI